MRIPGTSVGAWVRAASANDMNRNPDAKRQKAKRSFLISTTSFIRYSLSELGFNSQNIYRLNYMEYSHNWKNGINALYVRQFY